MTKKLILIIALLSVNYLGICQTDKEKALDLGWNAIKLMDEGELDESIDLLEQAQKLDPGNIDIPYEMALAYYKKEDYPKTIEILNTIKEHKDASDLVYQLLGNAQDMNGDPELALSTYQIGMEKFPKSGKFHLESGNIKYHHEKYNEAIAFWEEGIKVNPNYSSNYYWLAKIFSYSEERIWSIFYSELFILLEPNTKRTEEISILLYDNYQKSYEAKTDSTGEFHLTKKGFQIYISDKKDMRKLKKGKGLPFEGTFATAFAPAAIYFLSGINLHSIYLARKTFLDFWFKEKMFHKIYPNKLLDYQLKIVENGLFETYTYWILSQGSLSEFQEWLSKNEQSFNDFAEWFNDNRIEIKEKDFYSRRDYQ